MHTYCPGASDGALSQGREGKGEQILGKDFLEKGRKRDEVGGKACNALVMPCCYKDRGRAAALMLVEVVST